ncbi:MAG TPA: DDE-type integrase/transposase/recombinase, partial [Lactovum miscens]|uniref:DDE-type integrase/transposase/recombinase n=1 Tax=Lactovum miscens TaxID=190387 RepID=UPI002ED7A9B2
MDANLLSVKKIAEKGLSVIFENNKCLILKENNVILECEATDNLYQIQPIETNENSVTQAAFICTNKNCIELWHKRLAHKNNEAIKQIITHELADGITIDNCKHDTTCVHCIKSKLSDLPYPKEARYRASQPLDLVHTDVCGPIDPPSVSGYKYFVTFTDDFSRFTMIYLMKNKSEVTSKLKQYVALTNNKFGRKIKTLRSDNGGEYLNKELSAYFEHHGIEHQLTVPYCPAQNGVSERKNITLIETVRCLLSDSGLQKKFWAETILAANYTQNRLPTKSNKKTPFELWNKRKPDLSHLRTFGCKAFAHIPKQKRTKLNDTSIEGIFVGYDPKSKGYRILLPDDRIIISRTVRFIENHHEEDVPCLPSCNPFSEHPEEESIKDENVKESSEESDVTRSSQRSTKGQPPQRYGYYVKHQNLEEPKDWKEIQNLQKEEKEKWIESTKEEIKDLAEIKQYLGIEIMKTEEGNLGLSQTRKIEDLVRRFNLEKEKPTYLPMSPNYQKTDEDDELLPDNSDYRRAVGALLYIATVTRPDVANAVNLLSRRNEKPRSKDWNAIKKLISYLNTTKTLKLMIYKDDSTLTAYADADWGGDPTTRASTSGNLFKLGPTTISWCTKRQNCIAMSSTEAEYISAANATQEIEWIMQLTSDLGLPQQLPITIFEDNKSCIKLSQTMKNISRTKTIDIKYHYL